MVPGGRKNVKNKSVPFSCFSTYGDVITKDAAGGGGYGDPLERDIDRVEADVRDGYVSLEAAEKDYVVVIDPSTGLVDPDATRKKRETMIANRN